MNNSRDSVGLTITRMNTLPVFTAFRFRCILAIIPLGGEEALSFQSSEYR